LDTNGEGSYDNIVAGIDWVIQQHQSGGGNKKSVANLSLGGGFSDFLNSAIRQATEAGVVMVVAAGNEDQDACNVSPASESSAITVGSIDRDDARSVFSNWGNCVDIFAPGSEIKSAVGGGAGDSATAIMSGTSMASPRKYRDRNCEWRAAISCDHTYLTCCNSLFCFPLCRCCWSCCLGLERRS
jgi:subtilisin family serine protease